MKIRSILAAMTLVAAVPGVGAAQGPGGEGMGGGGMGGQGGHHYRESGRRQDLEGITTDPVVWNGPPVAADLPPKLQLLPDQQTRYATLYDTFMAATKRVRDQSQVSREIIYGESHPSSASSQTAVEDYKEEALYLSQKQDVFDHAIETFLTKDQIKEYQKWRKAERKRAEAEERKREEGMRGRGRPPD